jgi:hypothetical protein
MLCIVMANPDYKKMYDELWDKASELTETRAELEGRLGDISKEIDVLHETLARLAPLAGYTADPFDNSIKDLGITAGVREVLDSAIRMSTTEVRTKMEERGFDFSKYSAPDSTIRTVLNRLVANGRVIVEKEGWKTFYKLYVEKPEPEITDADIPF